MLARMSPSDESTRPSSASLERGGAVVTALFALAWAFTGTTTMQADRVAFSFRVGALVVTAAALVIALTFGARRLRGRASAADLPADWRRQFNIIGMVQGGAIALAVLVAIAVGVAGLIPASVCLIVGLHFFPVGRLLRMRYRPTGAALCVIAATGYLAYFTASPDRSVIIVGVGAALTLWHASFRHALTGLAARGKGSAQTRQDRLPTM